PVGAGLPAMAAWQPTNSLLKYPALLWERACSRKLSSARHPFQTGNKTPEAFANQFFTIKDRSLRQLLQEVILSNYIEGVLFRSCCEHPCQS
ncbi:hypothetical protein, partial [Pseudomonas sp. AM14(2022)]|uniref:hypothetical protein n=1 Tax=Pseudomonas sp. AM14(2022) TaxID=2983371 RepID=UPI002E80A4ED